MGRMTRFAALVAAAVMCGGLAQPSLAEQKKPKAEPTPSPGTPIVLPQPDFHFPGNVGRTYLDSDPAQFPQPVQAPKGAPNIVLIMIDDAGFGQFSTFGGGVPSPTMDKLAAEGVGYNSFHTTALCSPTRAALITARIGKNHNTPVWEARAAGPFDRWANGLGFDYFYGFNGGDMNHWNPVLYENRNLVPASSDPNYYLTTDLSDRAIAWMRKVKSIAPERPFLLYVAPGATHAPHHAPQDWIAKFKGQFDQGWDKYREETFARQKQLGVIPPNAILTPRPANLPSWDSLDARHKELYAGFLAFTDHNIGRVIDAVEKTGELDNTLVIYIQGDNGGSAEGTLQGT